MIQERILAARRRNSSSNPRQVKYLVNVDEVAAAAAERLAVQSTSLAERASRIRSRSEER
jgi:translation initiation factor IF-2